jgi:hypothetical protein
MNDHACIYIKDWSNLNREIYINKTNKYWFIINKSWFFIYLFSGSYEKMGEWQSKFSVLLYKKRNQETAIINSVYLRKFNFVLDYALSLKWGPTLSRRYWGFFCFKRKFKWKMSWTLILKILTKWRRDIVSKQ